MKKITSMYVCTLLICMYVRIPIFQSGNHLQNSNVLFIQKTILLLYAYYSKAILEIFDAGDTNTAGFLSSICQSISWTN